MSRLQNFVDRARNHDIPRIANLNDQELITSTDILRRRFKYEAGGSAFMVLTGMGVALLESFQSQPRPYVAFGGVAVGAISYVASCLQTGFSYDIHRHEVVHRAAEAAQATQQAELAQQSSERAQTILAKLPLTAGGIG